MALRRLPIDLPADVGLDTLRNWVMKEESQFFCLCFFPCSLFYNISAIPLGKWFLFHSFQKDTLNSHSRCTSKTIPELCSHLEHLPIPLSGLLTKRINNGSIHLEEKINDKLGRGGVVTV